MSISGTILRSSGQQFSMMTSTPVIICVRQHSQQEVLNPWAFQ